MTVIQNEVLDEETAKKDPQPGIQERSGRIGGRTWLQLDGSKVARNLLLRMRNTMFRRGADKARDYAHSLIEASWGGGLKVDADALTLAMSNSEIISSIEKIS